MWDTLIVGVIICAAAVFAVYRIFIRPSCGCDSGGGCGGGCGCGSKSPSAKAASQEGCCGGKGDSCNCGK